MVEKAAVIGGGIAGLACGCILAKAGYKVELFEKNQTLGGRCNIFKEKGFIFDMGPSWYLMPEVFEQFFEMLGERIEEHLELVRLSPSYRVFFKDKARQVDFYSDLSKDLSTVESLEPGSAEKFKQYLDRSRRNYEIAMKEFIYKNYLSIFDFLNLRMLIQGSRLSVFSTMQNYVRRFFKSDYMQKMVQYQLVFLGSSPYNTPALYNIMSHIDFNMGVYYPLGGIYKIVEALAAIGERLGVNYHTQEPVDEIVIEDGTAKGVKLKSGRSVYADLIVSNADTRHTETVLIKKPEYRTYDERYWQSRVLAPSGLIMYLGLKDKARNLLHHNLLFSRDWGRNFSEIFDSRRWPEDPSFYVCCPSKTDGSVAEPGKENIFVFVPIAPGLAYDEQFLEDYGEKILDTMEREMKIPRLKERLIFKKLFSVNDFKGRYNSYKGTALGLSHTLGQTAILRPDNKSKKVSNLFYAGANNNPGIGVPICLISAELAYKRIIGDTSVGALSEIHSV